MPQRPGKEHFKEKLIISVHGPEEPEKWGTELSLRFRHLGPAGDLTEGGKGNQISASQWRVSKGRVS